MTYGIGGKVDACCVRLQVENRSNERWVLMGETIVLLSRPGASLDVVDTRDICPPVRLSCHFVEFAILNHHGMYDAKEAFVTREYSCSSCQSISWTFVSDATFESYLSLTLHKPLAVVFTKHFNHSTTSGI